MKIGIFAASYDPQSGGAYTFVETIRRQIATNKDEFEEYVFLFPGGRFGKRELFVDGFKFINADAYRGKKASALDSIASEEGIDLYWFLSPLDVKTDTPYAFTIWDLAHRSAPYFPELNRTGWRWDDRERTYQNTVFKASYLITGNETGKKEILDNYRLPAEKIRVIPFPIPSFCFDGTKAEAPQGLSLPRPFLFYPAQFWPHKNHITVLLALRKLVKERGIELSAVFTGSDKGNLEFIRKKIDELGLGANVRLLGFVPEGSLKYLYQNAACMVFASLLGPNNLPPLEAAALGCPVVISDLPGHREQMGDAALYFSGYDESDLASKILRIVMSEETRDSLIDLGKSMTAAYAKSSYFGEMRKVIGEFALARRCWGTGETK